MTATELMGAVLFFIAMFGAIFGVWRYLDGKLAKADKVAADLADHKLHVAETYVTKAGMQEQTGQIMRAIEGVGNRIDGLHEGVGNRIDGLHERLDRAFERTTGRTTRS